MRLTNWLTKFATFSCVSPRKSRFAQTRRRQTGVGNRATAEVLEQRTLLTTFEVTTLAESGAGDGETSLREAIAEANSQAGADEIVFADGLQGRITLGSGQLSVSDDLTISGPAVNLLTIDGGDKFRVFDVTGDNDLTLNNLTIANGRTAGSSQRGAGIRLNSGILTVNNSTISGNTTLGSGSGGAGIHSTRGSVFLYNSTVSFNAVEGGGSFAYGGGIFSSEGSLTLTNSTVARNSAALGGGGIVFNIADVTIVNSTISGNTTSGSGGGIKAIENFNYVDLPTLLIHNSIVAGNSGNASGPDAHTTGSGISVGVFAQSSLIGDSTGSGWSTANLLNVDFTTVVETEVIDGNTVPTLGDNGGPTRTIALLVDSPAIDSGSNSLAKDKDGNDLTTDGRGIVFARTVDGNDDGNRFVDMGAFEAPFLGDLIVSTNTDIVDGDYSDGELSLRESLVAANDRPGADQVTFAANVSGSTILLTNGQLEVTDDLTITGPGEAGDLVIDAQLNSRVFDILVEEGTVQLHSLSITRGNVSGNLSGEDQETGGGIRFRSPTSAPTKLRILNSVISGNVATGGRSVNAVFGSRVGYLGNGPAIEIASSTITDNTGAGGTVRTEYSGGGVSIVDSTIADNSGSVSTGSFSGGVTVFGSVITGNGGGISSYGRGRITNTTITGNRGTGFRTFNGGDIINSTIAGNDDAGVNVSNAFEVPTVTIHNSIIAGNNSGGAEFAGDDLTELTVRHSLIQDATGTDLTDGVDSNQIGVAFELVLETEVVGGQTVPRLAENGGLVQTIALLPTSPAIDSGDNSLALDKDGNTLTTDARGSGFDRTLDGSLNGTATVDIGAFEVQRASGVYSNTSTGTVLVLGREGVLDFIVVDTTLKTVKLNNVLHDFSSFANPTFEVDGREGEDRLLVHLTEGDEVVNVGPDRVPFNLTVTGASTVNGNAEIIQVYSNGGADRATLFDRATTNDVFIAKPDLSYMLYNGQMDDSLVEPIFQHYVHDFPTVIGRARGSADGYADGRGDIAQLYDSAGDDFATAWPTAARLTDDASSEPSNRTYLSYAADFDYVNFWATAGGVDTAEFYDAAGDDLYVSRVTGPAPAGQNRFQTYLRDTDSTEFWNVANRFERTTAFSTVGNDQAQFYDTFGDDLFVANGPSDVYMSTHGEIFSYAKNFNQTIAFKHRGGTDAAQFYDGAGIDRFTANPTTSTLESVSGYETAYSHTQSKFDSVLAVSRVQFTGDDILINNVATNYTFRALGNWENDGSANGPVPGFSRVTLSHTGSNGAGLTTVERVVDPLSAASAINSQQTVASPVNPHFSLDVDGDGTTRPLTDGVLLLRQMAGFGKVPVSSGIVNSNIFLDVDGDGLVSPLTDGMLIIRYLAGFTGDALIDGVINTSASRTTAAEIETWLRPYAVVTHRPISADTDETTRVGVSNNQIDATDVSDTFVVRGVEVDPAVEQIKAELSPIGREPIAPHLLPSNLLDDMFADVLALHL